MVILAMLCITHVSAQDIRYYKLTRKMENGVSSSNVSGGQYITFIADICYESNKKGISVGHGNMTRNNSYSTSEYTVYFGSSYWGENAASFKFNKDKSVLNVVIDKDNYYIYKKATPPAGQETCSLIRKPSTTTTGGNEGYVGGYTPTPVYPGQQITPTPTPTPTPSPTPMPTPIPKPTHKCGLCNGTGRVINTNAVSHGNTKWCSECGKTVPDYHYHTKCPSCGGKGYW